jgi:hypothetical protein
VNESRVEGATHADRGGEDRAVAVLKGGRDQQGRRVIVSGDVLDEPMQAFCLEDGRDAQPGVLHKRVLSKVDGPDCSVRQRPIFLRAGRSDHRLTQLLSRHEVWHSSPDLPSSVIDEKVESCGVELHVGV